MSEISDAIQEKCLAFGDCVIRLNDYLIELANAICRVILDSSKKRII